MLSLCGPTLLLSFVGPFVTATVPELSPQLLLSLLLFFLRSMCLKSEASWLKKIQATATSASPTSCQRKRKTKRTSALPSHALTANVRKPFLPTVAITLSKGGTEPPSDHPTKKKTRNKGHAKEADDHHSLHQRHTMFKQTSTTTARHERGESHNFSNLLEVLISRCWSP